MLEKIRLKFTYMQLIALSFLFVILFGALLLSLPISSRDGAWTPYINSLFTSTSATCVTGLVVYDTFTHWSIFGQCVIMLLIQIGGLGFMTIVTLFSIFTHRVISLHERRLLMESAGTMRIGGVVLLIKRIALGTLIVEGSGALLLATRFCPKMGIAAGLFNSVFHSVSAFCNAGFDIMGKYAPFSSLTTFNDDIVVNLTIASLIVIGGIGFIVWSDICNHKTKFREYQLHSKIVIFTTAFLLVMATICYFIFEYNHAMKSLNIGEKILSSVFMSATPRTAGFNSVNLNELSESGGLLTMILMFIGGSPGSTAGGIKTTTLVVLLLTAAASARHVPQITTFKRGLEENTVRHATSVVTIYLVAVLVFSMAICAIEPFSLKQTMFETISAIGTVGLSMGITPSLSVVSKIFIMFLMYCGRIGGLTIAVILAEKKVGVLSKRPVEKILIG